MMKPNLQNMYIETNIEKVIGPQIVGNKRNIFIFHLNDLMKITNST